MIDQAMTIDEVGYIDAFSNLRSIEVGSRIWSKGSYQYRITEITSGLLTTIVNNVFHGLESERIVVFYKCTHWLFYAAVILGICLVWREITGFDKTSAKYRLFNAITVLVFGGFPVAFLVLKVSNYDAGHIYFGVLGLSLLILSSVKKNPQIALIASSVALLSALEKFPGLAFWCICVGGYYELVYRHTASMKKVFFAVLKSIVIAITICTVSLGVIRVAEGKAFIDMPFGLCIFPLWYLLSEAYGHSGIDFADSESINKAAITYFPQVIVLVIVFGVLLSIGYWLWNKRRRLFTKLLAISAFILLFVSIICSFVIKRWWYPWVEVPEDYYFPNLTIINGRIEFYNVKTIIGFLLCKFITAYSVIVTSWPTIITSAVMVCFAVCFFGKWRKEYHCNSPQDAYESMDYYCFIVLFICLVLPGVFSLKGMTPTPRYCGVFIMLIPIIVFYETLKIIYYNQIDAIDNGVAGKWIPSFKWKSIILLLFVFYILEMILFSPNYATFRPIWLVYSEEYKTTARKGQLDIGESMMWGEDCAIAGKKILKLIGEGEDYGSYKIFTTYGNRWLSNPGFEILSVNKHLEELSFTEKDYYVLTKFAVIRKTIPEFIRLIEPDDVVSYNGEISVWIYRGDRIKEYAEYFY